MKSVLSDLVMVHNSKTPKVLSRRRVRHAVRGYLRHVLRQIKLGELIEC